jgi:hypothetical protein
MSAPQRNQPVRNESIAALYGRATRTSVGRFDPPPRAPPSSLAANGRRPQIPEKEEFETRLEAPRRRTVTNMPPEYQRRNMPLAASQQFRNVKLARAEERRARALANGEVTSMAQMMLAYYMD